MSKVRSLLAHTLVRAARAALGTAAAAMLAACGSPPPVETPPVPPPPPPTAAPAASAAPTSAPSASADAKAPEATMDLEKRIAQFAPAKLTADVSKLPASERAALDKLIAASKLLEPVFDRQAWAKNPELAAELAKDTSPEGRMKKLYFDIMRGPWDRQEHFAPFATKTPRPPGAGFYPEDMTKEAFNAYVAKHPDQKAALDDLFTVVQRDGDKLKAVKYSEAYAEWLKPAAALLREAAGLTKNASLKKFLTSRAAAFESNDYYPSDKDWMDLDSLVEITIGPYETYEDDLFGQKASFEAFVTVSDPKASADLAKYKKLLPAMEAHLPVPKEVHAKRGAESPIRVVDLVYSSGDARKSVQTIAFNLPNDERVRKEKGAKKVMLRNLIETKFDLIMKPIGERIIDPSQTAQLSSEAFFDETLFHELSHSLGPAFTTKDGKKVEVRVALEDLHSTFEEAKADVMGAYNVLFMIDEGELPKDLRDKLLVSYFAGLFRSIRFGVAEAHGRGAAMQINWFLEEGGAKFDAKTGRFTVDTKKLEASIGHLVHEICMLQHQGDKAAVAKMLDKYGVMSDPMKQAMASLDGIPVDVRPIYPLAGE